MTAIPLFIAFRMGRRPGTLRYNYGYGRAEDLAGLFVILMIASSSAVAGVRGVDDVRLRWEGHRLRGELTIALDPALAVAAGHAIAHEVEHELLHGTTHLDAMSVHVEPIGGPRSEAHAITAHHYNTK